MVWLALFLFAVALVAAVALMTKWFKTKKALLFIAGTACGAAAFFLGVWAAAAVFLLCG